jgi:hypothetical protein
MRKIAINIRLATAAITIVSATADTIVEKFPEKYLATRAERRPSPAIIMEQAPKTLKINSLRRIGSELMAGRFHCKYAMMSSAEIPVKVASVSAKWPSRNLMRLHSFYRANDAARAAACTIRECH